MDIIWKARLDEQYDCQVLRSEIPHIGLLTITEDNKILFRKEVTISYDAKFGPDVADVSEWQAICIDHIDSMVIPR